MLLCHLTYKINKYQTHNPIYEENIDASLVWKAVFFKSKTTNSKSRTPIVWATKFESALSFVSETKPSSNVTFGLIENLLFFFFIKKTHAGLSDIIIGSEIDGKPSYCDPKKKKKTKKTLRFMAVDQLSLD